MDRRISCEGFPAILTRAAGALHMARCTIDTQGLPFRAALGSGSRLTGREGADGRNAGRTACDTDARTRSPRAVSDARCELACLAPARRAGGGGRAAAGDRRRPTARQAGSGAGDQPDLCRARQDHRGRRAAGRQLAAGDAPDRSSIAEWTGGGTTVGAAGARAASRPRVGDREPHRAARRVWSVCISNTAQGQAGGCRNGTNGTSSGCAGASSFGDAAR